MSVVNPGMEAFQSGELSECSSSKYLRDCFKSSSRREEALTSCSLRAGKQRYLSLVTSTLRSTATEDGSAATMIRRVFNPSLQNAWSRQTRLIALREQADHQVQRGLGLRQLQPSQRFVADFDPLPE